MLANLTGSQLIKSGFISVLSISALAGGVMLSGGEAKALVCAFSNTSTPPGGLTSCNYNQAYPTDPQATDKTITFLSGPSGGSGDIEWTWQNINNNATWGALPDLKVDEWHVDVDFNPDYNTPNIGPNTSVFEYILTLTPSPAPNDKAIHFYDVSLDAAFGAADPGESTVVKDIYEVINGNQKGTMLGSITCTGFANGSTSCGPSVVVQPNTSLYIVDTAVFRGRVIDSYHNAFRQVPGPLPILGAGAAFGFSRKLRGRIKSHSMG